MVTLSDFFMISSMVFALIRFLYSKTRNCPKKLSVWLSFFSSNISYLSCSIFTSSSSVNSSSCSCWGSAAFSVNVSFVAVVLLVWGGNWGLSRLRLISWAFLCLIVLLWRTRAACDCSLTYKCFGIKMNSSAIIIKMWRTCKKNQVFAALNENLLYSK